jgi:hypothetical protein
MPTKKIKAVNVAIRAYEKEKKDRIYSNYIVVKHTPFDFTIEFCELLPPTKEEITKTGFANAEIKAKLALPVKLIPSLITALTDNYSKYEAAHGKEKK